MPRSGGRSRTPQSVVASMTSSGRKSSTSSRQTFSNSALATDASKARAEFENVWREDVDDFLPLEVIEATTDWGVRERPPERGIAYRAFADAASGTGRDSFTLALGHAVTEDGR